MEHEEDQCIKLGWDKVAFWTVKKYLEFSTVCQNLPMFVKFIFTDVPLLQTRTADIFTLKMCLYFLWLNDVKLK